MLLAACRTEAGLGFRPPRYLTYRLAAFRSSGIRLGHRIAWHTMLPVVSRSPIVPRGGFLLRTERGDLRFLARRVLGGPAAGLVVSARILASVTGDDSERRAALAAWRRLLASPGLTWLFDPDTVALTAADIVDEPGAAERLREGPIGSSVELPLSVADVAHDAETRQGLLQATWAQQAGAAALSAPYVPHTRGDDLPTDVNLELVRSTARADGRPTAAWLQATVGTLTSGEIAPLARRYAAAGADVALLRIEGVTERDATARHVEAYVRAIQAFEAAGVQAVPDCVGRLGPVLVAAGATAFTAGSWHFRGVGRERLPRRQRGGGSAPVPYELPGRLRAAGALQLARQARSAWCTVPGCRALAPDATPGDLREHAVHEFAAAATQASVQGVAGMLSLLASEADQLLLGWAQGLRATSARSASS